MFISRKSVIAVMVITLAAPQKVDTERWKTDGK